MPVGKSGVYSWQPARSDRGVNFAVEGRPGRAQTTTAAIFLTGDTVSDEYEQAKRRIQDRRAKAKPAVADQCECGHPRADHYPPGAPRPTGPCLRNGCVCREYDPPYVPPAGASK